MNYDIKQLILINKDLKMSTFPITHKPVNFIPRIVCCSTVGTLRWLHFSTIPGSQNTNQWFD